MDTIVPSRQSDVISLPFSFNEDVSKKRISTLYESYRDKWGLFSYQNASTAPQNMSRPTMYLHEQETFFGDAYYGEDYIHRFQTLGSVISGSPEHINWLFFSTLTDRRQVSDAVYFAHAKLYAKYPHLYTRDVIKEDPKKFGEFLATFKIGVPRQSADYWIRCANTLFNEFDGNPINILTHCGGTVNGIQEWSDAEEKKTKEKPLPGYGPKITSLFTLFVAELGVFPMPYDSFPVDVHVQRFFLQQGLITREKDLVNDELEKVLRPFLCKFCNANEIDKIDMSHAFWMLGSKLCSGCSKRRHIHLTCPIERTCLGGVNTRPYFAKGKWSQDQPFMRKGCSKQFLIQKSSLFD